MTTEEKNLVGYLKKQSKCPICGGTRQTGHLMKECPFEPYMRWLPAELKVGDRVGIPADDPYDFYPCIVTRIIDDFTCEIYEKSINKYHIETAPIFFLPKRGETNK